MEGQRRITTRIQSSLLRSSLDIRPAADDQEPDIEEQKPHTPPVPSPLRPRPAVIAVFLIAICTFLFYFFNRVNASTSENLLVALIFVAIFLYLAEKNKLTIHHYYNGFKTKLGFVSNNSSQVQWFIGEYKKKKKGKVMIREGVEAYNNGDKYEGEFHQGMFNGSGVYTFSVNGKYEGDWVNGKYDGYGVQIWTVRGNKYRGQYRQGIRNGYGVYTFYSGHSYYGEWRNGQSDGIGVQRCSDGSSYMGEFSRGVKHGHGCYHFRNGDRYAGEYFGDRTHGFGVYHFATGHCYEGSWHEGRKQGYAMYTFRNGCTICGEWASDKLNTQLPQPTDAVLRAVEGARKAQQNAINIPKVDDQVKKAVTAANRAATAARVAAIKAVQNRTHE
ncbi:unnamed protein product [Withania somnifera]